MEAEASTTAFGSPKRMATSRTPAGGSNSVSATGRARAGSNPAAKRDANSAKYSPMHHRAAGNEGPFGAISIIEARRSRSTSSIATSSRACWRSVNGSSMEAARASDLRSS